MLKQRRILRILIILAIIGIPIMICLAIWWNKPLGPSLELPAWIPEIATRNPGSIPQETDDEPLNLQAQDPSLDPLTTSEPRLISGQQPLCGGPPVMTVLVIGSDYRGEGYLYGLADAIRVVRVDFITPSVSVLDFPRDLWVEIPGISDHYGVTHGKLNQAYFFGNPGMGYYDGPGEGPGLLARTLELNFNLHVDHYLTIDMRTLGAAIDAVGGVDVYFDTPVNLNSPGSTEDPSLAFSVGTHHLDGEQALMLVRNRVPSTFQRASYQNLILSALREKMLSPAMLPEVPGLITRFIDDTQTDLSPSEINKFVCLGQELTDENTRLVSFPMELFTPGTIFDPYRNVYTSILEANFDQIRSYVAQFMSGTWPAP